MLTNKEIDEKMLEVAELIKNYHSGYPNTKYLKREILEVIREALSR